MVAGPCPEAWSFPGEIYQAPRSWGEQNVHHLIYWNEADKGGHFAAWEQPELVTDEVRAACRCLRWGSEL